MRIYIAEDEPLAAAKLKLFLEKLGEGPDITHYDNGVRALAAIQECPPDILFLDIQMPGLTGMEILEKMPLENTQVIITSAFDQYALPAFRFQVTDYLLKPFSPDLLEKALRKAKESIRLRKLDEQVNAATLSIRCDGRNEVLHQADILSLESQKDYVRFSLRNGQHKMVLASLSGFESQLTEDFMRVHRSYIINKGAVVAFNGNEVTLCDGQTISVGKTYKGLFQNKSSI